MPNAETLPANDPVSRAIARELANRRAHPVPLVATAYDIAITGGVRGSRCSGERATALPDE